MKNIFIYFTSIVFLIGCSGKTEEDLRKEIKSSNYVYYEYNGSWKLYQSNNTTSYMAGENGGITLKDADVQISYSWISLEEIKVNIKTPDGKFECSCNADGKPSNDVGSISNTINLEKELKCDDDKLKSVHIKIPVYASKFSNEKKSEFLKLKEFDSNKYIGNTYQNFTELGKEEKLKLAFINYVIKPNDKYNLAVVLFYGDDFDALFLIEISKNKDSEGFSAKVLNILTMNEIKDGYGWSIGDCGNAEKRYNNIIAYRKSLSKYTKDIEFITENFESAWKINYETFEFEKLDNLEGLICLNPYFGREDDENAAKEKSEE